MSTWLLVVNVGSTSVKTRLFNGSLQPHAQLAADYSDASQVLLEGEDWQGSTVREQLGAMADCAEVLVHILSRWQDWLTAAGATLTAIGHRVVHGADWFTDITPISPAVMLRLAELDAYAPLHNPFNRMGIEQSVARFPKVAQFALFDTAFHRHLPEVAKRYAIPESLSKNLAFYRYGFHGLSCQYSVIAAAQMLATTPANLNLIILHLGGGASATAVRAGMSVDTSMGFSPTEGLMMASRCGDIDPMILLRLQEQGMSSAELNGILNHQSGLQGVCGETDLRRILHRAEIGDAQAILAIDMFCYRIKKYIGAYCAVLSEVSALVFTGGIGANSPVIRQKVLEGLAPLGFSLNTESNQKITHDGDISDISSHSRILVIHAEEERVCAKQMLTFINNLSTTLSNDPNEEA